MFDVPAAAPRQQLDEGIQLLDELFAESENRPVAQQPPSAATPPVDPFAQFADPFQCCGVIAKKQRGSRKVAVNAAAF